MQLCPQAEFLVGSTSGLFSFSQFSLLIGEFNLFTFKVITNRYDCPAIFVIFCLSRDPVYLGSLLRICTFHEFCTLVCFHGGVVITFLFVVQGFSCGALLVVMNSLSF